MFINVSGSFLIGVVAVLVARRVSPGSERLQLAGAIGFLGGYTTFSTFSLESFRLLQDGEWALATANVVGSALLGLIAVAAGMAVAKTLWH